MRFNPCAGLTLAAIVVATSTGVVAQNSNSASPASVSARGPAPAAAARTVSPLADAVQRQDKQAVQALLARTFLGVDELSTESTSLFATKSSLKKVSSLAPDAIAATAKQELDKPTSNES